MIKKFLATLSETNCVDEIELISDDRYPFPLYELEINWKEWRWNDARTDRMDDTISEGITVNPDDFADEDGRVIVADIEAKVAETLIDLIQNPERVGMITVRG